MKKVQISKDLQSEGLMVLKGEILRLLRWTNTLPQREDLVKEITQGRTSFLKEMTVRELGKLRDSLKERNIKMNQMRKKIISMAYQLGWDKGDGVVNPIDHWCLVRSKHKQSMNLHNYEQLCELVTQFDVMYKREVGNV